jgi:hypothetical protein
MPLQNVIKQFDKLKLTEIEKEKEKEQDDLNASQAYPLLLESFKKYFPTFWAEHEISPIITGCMLVKSEPNVGLNEHNTPALILEDKFLLYFYRNSAYQQMTISLKDRDIIFANTFECEFNKLSCEKDLYILISKAIKRYDYIQSMVNQGYAWKLN